jgi:hypothetical protein
MPSKLVSGKVMCVFVLILYVLYLTVNSVVMHMGLWDL